MKFPPVGIGVENAAGLIRLGAVAPARAESAGAEHQFGNPQPRVLAEDF